MNQETAGKNQFFRFFRNMFSTDRLRLVADKLWLASKTGKIVLAGVLLVTASGAYFGYQHWSFLNLAPTVVAGNFALEYKKIPYNVPSIDIVFSHDLDPATITANSVKIFPYVQGVPSLKDSRTVRYALGGNLEIGKKYLLQLTSDISSARGVRLAGEISYEIEAIGGVEVVKMIPTGETDALAKNPLFIFNIPVVPLSTLEEREKLPCPVKFVPEIKGRCTWPSGNVLEYRIDGTLDASTEYAVELALTNDFLFPLEKPFISQFSTTRIRVMTGSLDDSWIQRFSPKEGIPVTVSAPVSKEVFTASTILKDGAGNIIPHTVVSAFSGTAPSTKYFISGQSGPLPFASEFTLEIAKWLLPSPGNLALEQGATIHAKSNAFVLSVSLLKTVWSSTGELMDTNDLTYYGFIPSINPRFDIVLDEPVDIASLGASASDAVRLEAKWSQVKYPCELKQPEESVQESEESTKTVLKPAPRRLQCLIRGTLPLGTQYELVFDSKLSSGLKEAVRMPYSTPAEFTIDSIVPVSATEICAYTTNPIDYSGSGIIFSPNARVKEVTENQYRPDYSYSDKELQYICPEKKWVVANVVAARLNGNAAYSVVFDTDLKDIYWNSLKTRYSKETFTTPPLRKQDEYLYFMPGKDTQVIPSDAPIVLPVQSINLSAMNIQACVMWAEEYSDYLNRRWNNGYTPACISTVKKRVQLKNTGWNLATARVDLATDVFGGELPGNIILVQASADDAWTHNWPEQRDFQVVYLRTNLSIMMEKTGTGAVFFATDLDGNEVPKDLEFKAYGCPEMMSGKIPSVRFDASKGIYEWNLPNSSADCYRVIAASSPSGKHWIVVPWTDGVSDYDFGQFGGADTSNREYAYLHTDRPIYRAGDAVYFQGILRTFAPTGYVKSSAKHVKIRILNNENALFKEIEADVDDHSNFRGEFALVPEMKTGRYYFEILARNNGGKQGLNNPAKIPLPTVSREADSSDYYVVNDGNFYVEQYSKPTFKTEVAGGERNLLPGDTIDSQATATYYFGWRVANAPIEWTVLAQDYYFDPKEYSEYRFGTDSGFIQCRYWGVCSTNDEYLGTFSRTLDSSGTSRIGYTAELRKLESPEEGKHVWTPDSPKERLITLAAEVTDPNTGKTVTGTDSHVVHVTDGYVGIMSPYWIEKDGQIPVEWVVLDVESRPKSADVKLELIRVEWNSVKKLGVDGVFYNDYELAESLEDTEEVSSSKDGRFKVSLKPKNGGEYKIRASYTGKNWMAYVSDSYSYVSTDAYRIWNTGNNSVTDLTVEKTLTKPGETAVFTLKSPVAKGKIFYSVEKDDRILASKVIDITGYAQKIEIPVDASYIPNVYVRAYIIGRDDSKGLPVFKRALSQIRVLPDSKKLSVGVTPEKPSYLPGETLKIKVSVKDADGKPVNGAIGALSVVDESVLALLGNPEKNPFAFFYEMKRYLWTRVSLSLMNLVEKIEIKNVAQGEKWGAGEGNKWWDTKKKRGVFKDTAFWTGEFKTDAEGNVVIDTGALPDNLTTWKIEAVISTDDTKIGVGRAAITTEQKVMIQENFPRFLRTSDTLDFAPVVFNRTGKRGRFIVEMMATWATVSNARQEIALDSGESRPVLFQVIPNQLPPERTQAPVEISVSAVAESGESDGIARTLTVYRGEIYETTAYIGVASGNSVDERLNLSTVWPGASLTLNASPTLLGNVLSGLEHMLVYPYGCIEQITSAIVPHIAVKRMYDSVGVPYDLKTKTVRYYDVTLRSWQERTISDMLSDYVVRAMGYRLSSGGFGYWSTDVEYANFALSAYVMDTLADIRDLNIPVDQSVTKGAVEYLKTRLEKGVYEGCNMSGWSEEACKYPTREKLQAIAALSRWSEDWVYAFKALKNVDASKDTLSDRIERLKIISILLEKNGVPQPEKEALRSSAREGIDYILKNSLVYDPRGAYIAPDNGYSRTLATAGFVRVLALLGEDTEANRQISDNMTRFLVRMKQGDGGYGSTLDTAAVLRAFADRTSRDSQLRNTSFDARVRLNDEEVYHAQFWAENLLSSSTTDISLKNLAWVGAMNISTNGVGRLYYDLMFRYPVTADKVVARDEWFFIQTEWYDYLEYQKIEEAKALEFGEYLAGKKRYSELAYPKEIREYVKPIVQTKVGQLVRVEYRVILSETRDKVAFESFIPSGAELINTRLSTETKRVKKNTFFDREDLFDDRYFAYAEVLEPGEYSGSYAIRFTHAGEFSVPPSRIFEFYTPEVFWQTKWNIIEVTK